MKQIFLDQYLHLTQYTMKQKVLDQHLSALARFRCRIAAIRIETGRYEGLPENERICPVCENVVEDEYHVLCQCPSYTDLREEYTFSKSPAIIGLQKKFREACFHVRYRACSSAANASALLFRVDFPLSNS